VEGSHCLMTVGMIPNTGNLGLEEAGVRLGQGDFVEVDRVSRTSVPGVYAAGDCTGVNMLASVAAMQGRIAMWHALGEAVAPLQPGILLVGVIVGPRASELILGVSVAVQQRLTVDDIAHTFSVYPSLSGSVTEAARSLMLASPE